MNATKINFSDFIVIKKENILLHSLIFKECYQNHFSNFIVIKKEKHFITFSNS